MNLKKKVQTDKNKQINDWKYDKPNYMKNTKSKEKMIMSKSTEKKNKEVCQNKPLKGNIRVI